MAYSSALISSYEDQKKQGINSQKPVLEEREFYRANTQIKEVEINGQTLVFYRGMLALERVDYEEKTLFGWHDKKYITLKFSDGYRSQFLLTADSFGTRAFTSGKVVEIVAITAPRREIKSVQELLS